MGLNAVYDYEEKILIYRPVSIYIGEPNDSERYSDEKSIDEYLSKYGLTRQDVKEYQEYAIYDVIVKTWTKARITQWYWLENLKLKLCKVEDNTFQFEEESVQSEAEEIETIETDTNGSWEKSVHYNWDGNIQYWDEYEYNKEGRFTKNITYDGDDRINEWQEFEYNEEGNCIKYIRCYGNFDAFENMVEIKTNGEVSDSYEYEYAYVD